MQKILEERERQIKVEGWTPEHDAEHDEGDLLRAGQCYETAGDAILNGAPPARVPPLIWPWHPLWWKPTDNEERNYVKAGALFKAEADRYRNFEHNELKAVRMDIAVERVAAKIDHPKGSVHAPEKAS